MPLNQHVVTIQIFWPDDKWERETEQDYLIHCLQEVLEYIEDHVIKNQHYTQSLHNMYGRKFAEIEVNPARRVTHETR